MPDTVFLPDRIEVTRPIPASPSAIFDIVRSPAGHVAIDASGMLQDFTGEPAEKVGDRFVIHMDRESLNDFPLGKYDVTVNIIVFEPDKEIAWDLGPDIPIPHFYGYRLEAGEDGLTNVTSYYDWSKVEEDHKGGSRSCRIRPSAPLWAFWNERFERASSLARARGGTSLIWEASNRSSWRRADLWRSCAKGSIRRDVLSRARSYPWVHHGKRNDCIGDQAVGQGARHEFRCRSRRPDGDGRTDCWQRSSIRMTTRLRRPGWPGRESVVSFATGDRLLRRRIRARPVGERSPPWSALVAATGSTPRRGAELT